MPLNRKTNFHEPGKRFFRPYRAGDDFYEALIKTHQDLSDEQSAKVNARLVLILANHVGDLSVLREAMDIARRDL
ncbi:MAG: DUF2783 domain-containing protein [Gammaproteobacteria bacterium]|nr:DUF2783 domain-containing protein [Gammaproteobacteria bacterium]